MNLDTSIKAILFDSGRVLNYPQSGHWFISPNFFNIVDNTLFNQLDAKRKIIAFSKAGDYIHTIKSICTKEDELRYFTQY